MLAHMELVDPLPGLGELVSGEIPDPGGAVSEDQGRLGLEEPALERLRVQLPPEVGEPRAGGDIAPVGDDRPVAGGRPPLVQAEDRRGVDPVPAPDVLPRLPALARLPPAVPLPDVPGVDLDDQRAVLRQDRRPGREAGPSLRSLGERRVPPPDRQRPPALPPRLAVRRRRRDVPSGQPPDILLGPAGRRAQGGQRAQLLKARRRMRRPVQAQRLVRRIRMRAAVGTPSVVAREAHRPDRRLHRARTAAVDHPHRAPALRAAQFLADGRVPGQPLQHQPPRLARPPVDQRLQLPHRLVPPALRAQPLVQALRNLAITHRPGSPT